jgi:hypothetical protein
MLECCWFFNMRHVLYILEWLNMLELLLLNFGTCYMSSKFVSDVCCCFFNIRPAMVSKKYLELVKKQAWDRYGRFASPSSYTAPPPSRQEVGSSSRHCTAPPPSRQEDASSNDSIMEMWEVAPPRMTRLEEVSSDDSPSTSSGYNDECPTSKRWAHMNCF